MMETILEIIKTTLAYLAVSFGVYNVGKYMTEIVEWLLDKITDFIFGTPATE